MVDIVERLRNGAMSTFVQHDAADEIERLREELKIATAALYAIRDGATGLYGDDLDVCQKALRRIEGKK